MWKDSVSKLYQTWAGLVVKELWYSLDSAAFYVTLGKLLSLSVPLSLPAFDVSDAFRL